MQNPRAIWGEIYVCVTCTCISMHITIKLRIPSEYRGSFQAYTYITAWWHSHERAKDNKYERNVGKSRVFFFWVIHLAKQDQDQVLSTNVNLYFFQIGDICCCTLQDKSHFSLLVTFSLSLSLSLSVSLVSSFHQYPFVFSFTFVPLLTHCITIITQTVKSGRFFPVKPGPKYDIQG